MFLAEVKNLLLTAGHDLEAVQGTLTLDVAREPLSYVGMGEREQQLVVGDLYLSDQKGILSSIMNGPDHRTRILPTTKSALYFVYGVEGITEKQIYDHLHTIGVYLSQVIPGVKIHPIDIY